MWFLVAIYFVCLLGFSKKLVNGGWCNRWCTHLRNLRVTVMHIEVGQALAQVIQWLHG